MTVLKIKQHGMHVGVTRVLLQSKAIIIYSDMNGIKGTTILKAFRGSHISLDLIILLGAFDSLDYV